MNISLQVCSGFYNLFDDLTDCRLFSNNLTLNLYSVEIEMIQAKNTLGIHPNNLKMTIHDSRRH